MKRSLSTMRVAELANFLLFSNYNHVVKTVEGNRELYARFRITEILEYLLTQAANFQFEN